MVDYNNLEEMANFFNQRAQGYDKKMYDNVENFDEFYAEIAQTIPVTDESLHILDLGCGTGLELEPIFARVPNAQITGIDLSSEMLALLTKKYADRLSQISLIEASYLDYPFEKDQFDYCISVMTVHHILKPKKIQLYQNIHHALKPGGKYIEADYIVSASEERRILSEYETLSGGDAHQTDGVFHFDIPMSLETLRVLTTRAGFTKMSVYWQTDNAAIFKVSAD